MKTLSTGSRGPQVQLLQLALQRAGYSPGATDGVFGGQTRAAVTAFQRANGLTPDGVAGARTHTALRPWYVGYVNRTVQPGDTFYRLSVQYGTTVRAIEIANPGVDPLNLTVGTLLRVPLGFPQLVPTTIDWFSGLVSFCCEGLAARYPFLAAGELGRSVMDKPLWLLRMGSGSNRVFYNAAHHANEWITTPLLLRFVEVLSRACAYNQTIAGESAREMMSASTLAVAPCVDPDGLDLVTGDLTSGPAYESAAAIAGNFPGIPFPSGWKANIRGTDLNLQYPAGWERAREIKFSQGFTQPAPRDYVGDGPLSAPESLAVYNFTLSYSPALTLSYHTQGRVIYWKFLNYEPPGAREIAERFSRVSGYAVEEVPYASSFAGYKDWFIQQYNRPGYTIEAGLGDNPLPISMFENIYSDNLGILTLGLTATRE